MKITEKLKHFIRGIGSVLNLFPEPPKIPVHEEGVCGEDWEAIGRDFKKVMGSDEIRSKKAKMFGTKVSEEEVAKALGFKSVEDFRKYTRKT